MPRTLLLFFAALTLARVGCAADEPWHRWVSPTQFRTIALRLAPRVDLFQAIWNVDGSAELYGGTSRDFLWFLRGKLSAAGSTDDVEKIVRGLEARVIDAREFIAPESDVDVISESEFDDKVLFDPAFVTRIERVAPEWFQPNHARYQQELLQGGIPVEKIRLGLAGFRPPVDPTLDGGVDEIYRGVPTLGYRETIRDTQFFKDRENHPLLLVLRWLRQTSVAYFHRFGRGAPNEGQIQQVLHLPSVAVAQAIVGDVLRAPAEIEPYFRKESFARRANRQIQKSYRSHINQNVARAFHARFSIDEILSRYVPTVIRPYHSVMFAHVWPEASLAAWAADAEVSAAVEPFLQYARREGFADGDTTVEVQHGTPSLDAYRSLVFAGAAPSESGSAGSGVYVSDRRYRTFVEGWRADERPKELGPLVVRLRIAATARFIDITQGPGAALWKKFDTGAFGPVKEIGSARYDEFANRFGIDVLRYSYGSVAAYVVKNGEVLQSIVGDTMPLMTYREAAEALTHRRNDANYATTVFAADRSLWAHLGGLLVDWSKEARFAVLTGLLRAVPGVFFDRWSLLQTRLATAWPESTEEILQALEPHVAATLLPPPAASMRHDVFTEPDEKSESFRKRVRAIAKNFPPVTALHWFRLAGLTQNTVASIARLAVVKAVLDQATRFRGLREAECRDFEMIPAFDDDEPVSARSTQRRLRSLGQAFAARWPASPGERPGRRRPGRLAYFFVLDDWTAVPSGDLLRRAVERLVAHGDANAAVEAYETAWRFGEPLLGLSTEILRVLAKTKTWTDAHWSWWIEAVAASAPFSYDRDWRERDDEPTGLVLPGFQRTDETRTGVASAVMEAHRVAEKQFPDASGLAERLIALPAKTRLRILQSLLVESDLSARAFLLWKQRLWPESEGSWKRDFTESALALLPLVPERDGAEAAVGFLQRLVAMVGVESVRVAGLRHVLGNATTARKLHLAGAMLRVPSLANIPKLRDRARELQTSYWLQNFERDTRLLVTPEPSGSMRGGFYLSSAHSEPLAVDLAEEAVRALPEKDRSVTWGDLLVSPIASRWMVDKLDPEPAIAGYLPADEWVSVIRGFAVLSDPLVRVRHLLSLDQQNLPMTPNPATVERVAMQFGTAANSQAFREALSKLDPEVRNHPFLNVLEQVAAREYLRFDELSRRSGQHSLLECVRALLEAQRPAKP